MTGSESLFQQAVARVLSIADVAMEISSTIVVCNDDHRFLVSEQLREIGSPAHQNILEPEGKNTAPAVTLAALQATELSDDPILFVTP
ncbi:sugar phosphate nucleotidyltransferase, partial [Acinetobacter baumannii]